MSRLIIDSGATKTEWVLLETGKSPVHIFTAGINANYLSDEEIKAIFSDFPASIGHASLQAITHIYYYGAGCGNITNIKRIHAILHSLFHNAEIFIYTDLLGACHALCGKSPGWVAILGTGSNACFYDGEKIARAIPSLGYLLGDEGSGSHLGKTFLTAYLSNQFPEDLQADFEKEFSLNYDSILTHIYRKPKANHFMASFAPYILQQLSHPFVREVAKNAFSGFFDKQLLLYTDCTSFHICGSIGYHFREVIEEIAAERNIRIGKIVTSPMPGLIEYYENG